MPWRRARRKVERPVDVSRSIEESLEEAAEGEEEEDLVELAELDGATIAEAATGEPDPDREPSDLAIKLQNVLDAPHLEPPRRGLDSEATHRLRLPQSAAPARPRSRASTQRPGPISAYRSSSTSPATASTTTCTWCTSSKARPRSWRTSSTSRARTSKEGCSSAAIRVWPPRSPGQ